MKKVWNIGFSFTIALSFFIAMFGFVAKQANAATYDNTNPYSTGCAYKKPIVYDTIYIYHKGKPFGYLQLRGSAGCHTAWGYVKLYSPAPTNNYVNAYVQRKGSGYTLSCDSKGGNKAVQKGQTSCYTPQIWDRDPYKARAKAYFYGSKFTVYTNYY